MKACLIALSAWVAILTQAAGSAADPPATELDRLVAEFRQYSGAELVFRAADLPPGEYFEILPELTEAARLGAARIACREIQKYPPHYLGELKLRAIGIFRACASRANDGFHPFDKALGGYRYFGLYNQRDALVAAYYTDEQLPLTLDHELFHHIDRLTPPVGDWAEWIAATPGAAASGAAVALAPADRAALQRLGAGHVLEGAVSDYASKNPNEDKAETARHFLSTLPDSLLQMDGKPRLAGSRRIELVLATYARSNSGRGPDADWFLKVAQSSDRLSNLDPDKLDAQALATMLRLRRLACERDGAGARAAEAAEALPQAAALVPRLVEPVLVDELVRLYAALQYRLFAERIQPAGQFLVRGQEDAQGVNHTLRDDVAEAARAAERVGRLNRWNPLFATAPADAQLESVKLVDAYYAFIAAQWQVTPGTRRVFQHTCDRIAATMPPPQAALAVRIMQSGPHERESSLTADGRWNDPAAAERTARPATTANAHLEKVDAEVSDPKVRAALGRVQPACVQISNGSGVNVSPLGCILTAAHVAEARGRTFTATFPDGQHYRATCVAIDAKLDLAICRLAAEQPLPFARLALSPPRQGDRVVCIGQPGTTTPEGKPTHYEPFHVSAGKIRGFLSDPLGPQSLGRTKHDAWTYWGHSGSPLFDEQGEIVALHNSWDSDTAMRHAVTQQAIAAFLAANLALASGEE